MPREPNYPDELTKQRYLEESFNKERDTRLRWYFNVAKPSQADGELATSRQHEVLLRRLQAACPKPTEELLRLRTEKQQERDDEKQKMSARDEGVVLPPIAESTAGSTTANRSGRTDDVTLPPIGSGGMKPVDRQTLRKIYDGSSREGKGRYSYLKTRHEVRPENKYIYPLVSSWEYGWRLDDVIKVEEMRNPEFGRSRIVADTFYRSHLDGLSHRI